MHADHETITVAVFEQREITELAAPTMEGKPQPITAAA
jgi:hypothetical protein